MSPRECPHPACGRRQLPTKLRGRILDRWLGRLEVPYDKVLDEAFQAWGVPSP